MALRLLFYLVLAAVAMMSTYGTHRRLRYKSPSVFVRPSNSFHCRLRFVETKSMNPLRLPIIL